HKVYIIDEAHMLTREAWNVLLKILEEPPPGVVFVFATTEPQKITNTAAPVMSRLQRFDFRRIGPTAIQQRLRQVLAAEHLDAEDDALVLIARQADGGMRDALSVLDQCLSFGDGILTAARVRQALGLLDDEAYGEVLAAVADRQPGQVFAIMDRVADAGADLAEFAGGLAELLRALVMRHYGAEPEGLPESTRSLIAEIAPRLAPEDAVRMLKLLGEAEPALRRSANPRIGLETLLLRWAMMDRAVDLRAILAGAVPLPAAAGKPITERTALRLEARPVSSDRGAAATATRQSPLLGQALAHATPKLEAPGMVGLGFGPDSALFQDGAARQLAAVETILTAAFGTPVKVKVQAAAVAAAAIPAQSRRLSAQDARSERLTQLRSRDPALDAAAKALDLELMDDG